jgi:hypothetical protein
MADTDESYVVRKERAMGEDLKTAFSGYDRLIRQVSEIRRWTVTVQVAALGIAISGKLPTASAALIPAAVALLAFMILELRERSSMRFNKKEVLEIERIFMIKDLESYRKAVSEFEFRDLRLDKIDRPTKLLHLAASIFDLNILLWYGFWAVIVGYVSWRLI